ncbi:MAG: DUF2752 domain-containing protein [Ruminococcaceae bacterium]|nr:DUF2752 domain-containing protein [Oscillospiraceae bacterium]
MFEIKNFKVKCVILILFVTIVLIAREFGITCIVRQGLGFPCPGCGMTRACLSLLRLDFKAAFSFHGMVWSMPILLLYYFCDGRLFRKKQIDVLVLSFLVTGFLANWVRALILF